ncbi:MAG: type II toxin-antitoxin system RelE/ParE family toxin [Rickettsiales bacterium]|nr:type II toxin-antitoxin system RelE/ParE family toxin [Rickettsiales bacterium]
MNKFRNKITEEILNGECVKGLPTEVIIRAKSKLILIIGATSLIDLKSPPSNNLEKLQGNRQGQYSIRVNAKYRICFEWVSNEAFEIEFIDYHK